MAIDFSPLQQIDPGGAFLQGRERAQAQADRNMLRQVQAEQRQFERENMLAQRQERAALTAQRQAQEARAAQTAELDREIKTLDYASRRLFGATPETYQAIRADLSRINPQFGAGLPPEYDEAQVKALAQQGMSLKDQIEAASGRAQYMSTPYGPFDPRTGEYKMPSALPARAPAPAPTAPIRLRPGETLVSPAGEAITSMPPAPPRVATARGGAAPSAPGAKPPTAAQAAKSERMAEARQALSQEIENQLGYYEELANIGGMTSPKRSPVANIAAYARSSGIGQEAERAIATEAQTLRDNIKNTRQRLFMQIKDATGATSGQMNSNMEMQAWLDSMTNPQQSIETVRETLKQMDAVIAGVRDQVERERERTGKTAPQRPAAAPAPTPAAAPAPAAPAKRREIAPGVFVTERP